MAFIDDEFYDDTDITDGLRGKPTPATLAKWRVSGDGPKFIRVGRTPRYRGADINAWLQSRTVTHTHARRSAVERTGRRCRARVVSATAYEPRK